MDPAIVYTERQSVVSLRTISSQCQYGPHYNGNGTNRERKNGGLGQWLWLSRKSGCVQQQRSVV